MRIFFERLKVERLIVCLCHIVELSFNCKHATNIKSQNALSSRCINFDSTLFVSKFCACWQVTTILIKQTLHVRLIKLPKLDSILFQGCVDPG